MTFAHHARKADSTNSLIFGDLEKCLHEGAFYFISKNGAKYTNIGQINFTISILKGITSDITTISPEEQKYYVLSAFPKIITIGRYQLCEAFIENMLKSIDQKADRIEIDTDINKIHFSIRAVSDYPIIFFTHQSSGGFGQSIPSIYLVVQCQQKSERLERETRYFTQNGGDKLF